MNFAGALDLADTAALLSECVALVSNDSGLMHVGVAVGNPDVRDLRDYQPGARSDRRAEHDPVTKVCGASAPCVRRTGESACAVPHGRSTSPE